MDEIRPMIKFVQSLKRENLIGVEIGVLSGFHAQTILTTLPIKTLYLVDPYENYKGYLDIKTSFGYFARKQRDKRLARFKDKIIKIQKFSSVAKDEIPDDLDFVYIDGNHAYEYVLEDIKNYFPKVKKGGVIGGHDYYNKGKAREVKKAVDEYVQKNKLKLYVDGIDWWLVK